MLARPARYHCRLDRHCLRAGRRRGRPQAMASGRRSGQASRRQAGRAEDEAEADVLAYMGFPAHHRAKIHSNNPLERLNGEIKRRSDVVWSRASLSTPQRSRRRPPRRRPAARAERRVDRSASLHDPGNPQRRRRYFRGQLARRGSLTRRPSPPSSSAPTPLPPGTRPCGNGVWAKSPFVSEAHKDRQPRRARPVRRYGSKAWRCAG